MLRVLTGLRDAIDGRRIKVRAVASATSTFPPLFQQVCSAAMTTTTTTTTTNGTTETMAVMRDEAQPISTTVEQQRWDGALCGQSGFLKKKRKVNKKDSSSTFSFPLGNGIEVQLPALPSLLGRDEVASAKQQVRSSTEFQSSAPTEVATISTLASLQLDSLGLPKSVATTIASTGGPGGSAQLEKALLAWPDVFFRLKTVALPLLLEGKGEPEMNSLSEASLAQGFHILTETLDVVDSVARATGLRAERAFPASLVEVLWNVLPSFYALVQHMERGKTERRDGEETLPASREGSLSPMKELKRAGRALALRTRDLDDLLSPSVLVQALVSMERCGALSDDIIGPIGTNLLRRYNTSAACLDGPQHVATKHLLSAEFVASAADANTVPFKGDVAVALVRLLGRVQVTDHFQLHRLLHTILLPAVVPAMHENAPDEAALFEVTACYARYAVSGSAVVQLTALWMPFLPHLTLDRCTELLRAVGSGRATRKSRRSLALSPHGNGAISGAEEDYMPLVDAVVERANVLCRSDIQREVAMTSYTNDVVIAPATASINAGSLSRFICSLVTVNSSNWAEAYVTTATAMAKQLDALPIGDLVRVTNAIMHRNSHMPYHPLHALLVRRLLSVDEAMRDVRVGNVALLAAALMSSRSAPFASSSASRVCPLELDVRTAGCGGLADSAPFMPEANCALAVFRRHGTKLGLRGFVAGMCVAPLGQLPRRAQERVIMHFTSIASAIEVPWLAKGIAALISQIPGAVDPVSVQRWFSRFAAVDVVRQLDVEHATTLLNILSDENYGRDCALAKRSITTQAGKLLLQESFPLGSLAPLALALQRSNVFFPHLYSRMCRVLLSNVRWASWELLLPAFHAAADEFTRVQHGNGCVFRDVWEQLRSRIMEEAAASLSANDVAAALNGFAALDGRDRPAFSLLLHRLWIIYRDVLATAASGGVSCDRGANASLEIEEPQQTPARWVDEVLTEFTPSALAASLSTLIYMGDGEIVNTFLPWMLLRIRPVVKDLYPIDLLQLMPALLHSFSAVPMTAEDASRKENTSWLCNPVNIDLLHATHDGCRELFLHMYEDESTAADAKMLQTQRAEWSPKVRVSVSHVPRYLYAELLIALSQAGVQDAAVATASAVCITRRSCACMPISMLVDLAMALCFHFPPQSPDDAVLAGESTWESAVGTPPGGVAADTSLSQGTEAEKVVGGAVPPALAPNQRFLPPVLNAIWDRVEELHSHQIDAMVRCFRHYYGEKVDNDFLLRLQRHNAALAEVKNNPKRLGHVVQNSGEKSDDVMPVVKQDTVALNEFTAEDLFA
ncbi:hypothetical protein DQ04_00421040 [Trypanosoma grayi]|uniref:hypothetical protein n=1 Tax=Trypanosoma grayi TaxID=71804 RepID=UPI0004F42351|nr:hypothetical protein DQ04_00421040 [Trypanosoma grayi]KEG14525.1 hypothetical protein DQ04_00421040 [Trypanosoma grayi]